MRITFCGDPHGDFAPAREAAPDADALIFVGDQTPARPLSVELGEAASRTWFILGNHDCSCPEWLDRHDLPPERNLHARVAEIAGVRVAGLGGHFQGKIWMPGQPPKWRNRVERIAALGRRTWRGGLPLGLRCAIFPEDLEALATMRADVLVAHEAPSTHLYGFSVIDDPARAIGTRLIVHGHHHGADDRHYEGELPGGIRVVGLVQGEVWTSRLPI